MKTGSICQQPTRAMLALAIASATLVVATQSVRAQTLSVLYTFTGAFRTGGLVRDSEGNLYGTTGFGGIGAGTVFKLSLGKDGAWTETVLYTFAATPDGGFPEGGLILDSAGNLYGTTIRGGTSNLGTVFKVTKTGKETVLYNFWSVASCADGEFPNGGLVRDADGNLYGTTALGGNPAFKALPKELWENYGMHQERGKESIAHLVRLYAGHDLNHLGQMEKIVEGGSWRNSKIQHQLFPNHSSLRPNLLAKADALNPLLRSPMNATMAAASTVRSPPCSKRIYERLQGRNILFDSGFYHQRFFKSWKVTDFVRAPARILPALIESERAMPNNYIASLRLAQMEIAANTTKKRSPPVIVV